MRRKRPDNSLVGDPLSDLFVDELIASLTRVK
jgi:hypothetical protein